MDYWHKDTSTFTKIVCVFFSLTFDSRAVPNQHDGYSRSFNEPLHQFTSVVDFDKENNENIRTYTELTTVNPQRLTSSSTNLQPDSLHFEIQKIDSISSSQLSPSSTVRSIVTTLLQQYVPSSSSPSNTKKQKRTEGKYGEEITSSNKLNQLIKKETTLHSKKRQITSTKETNITSIADDYDNDLETTTKKSENIRKKI
ncbi:unnamed protein product [Rotaria magnacalcarata]|uniref:Uncharacterized protein n=1 Tax=Rotaria magnacalcarata TaxID=392030 RepID=A0A816Y654_9BILA|nr:unnamed protein product [Rotaria magnacalcarata]CAF2156631.1 unnamed protein product [Rotaria magnacalcarata]CAF4130077.1 unnamed protein product [Rotaria magnacalcarata]CAF4156897.1 unnamed protein product [Rotaria magnacalcarata]